MLIKVILLEKERVRNKGSASYQRQNAHLSKYAEYGIVLLRC